VFAMKANYLWIKINQLLQRGRVKIASGELSPQRGSVTELGGCRSVEEVVSGGRDVGSIALG